MGFERLRKSLGPETLLDSTKYAVALIQLGPAVTPANYAALKSAIEAVPGIDLITLLADHPNPLASPDGYHQVLRGRVEINLVTG